MRYLVGNHKWRAIMAPERPLGADAIQLPDEPLSNGARQTDPFAPEISGSDQLYAALDLGTNSCRMLIAQPKGSQFLVLDSFSKTVQLGAGLEASGRLSRASMGRTLQALRICQKKIEKHGVRRLRLVATEACRRARNGRDFMRQIKRETGLVVEIIAAEEEARLAVISCAPLVQPDAEQLLVVDIGGGSTELVWIDLSAVCPRIGRAPSCGYIRVFVPRARATRGWSTGFRCRWVLRR